MLDYGAIGRRIKTARKARGMTQFELAELVNISGSFYGHIERGTRIPSLETLVSIGHALNISLDNMINPNNDMVCIKRSDLQQVTQMLSTSCELLKV